MQHNLTSMLDHPLTMPEPNSGCWIWTGRVASGGHPQLKYHGELVYGHRLSYELSNGPIVNGLWVLHKCNNAACVNPDHLYLGTHADNMRDMKVSGRRKGKTAGEKSARAKLNERQVAAIREYYSRGFSQKFLADRYGVGAQCVYSIVHRKNWGMLNA